MTVATLIKISAQKKLMMKINDITYDFIRERLTAECTKKNFPTDRLAAFSLTNDNGEDNYFMMISLDKYDKLNMRKFEQLLRKEVSIQFRLKPYDFIPDNNGGNRLRGINLELTNIRLIKKKVDQEEDLKEIEHSKEEARREVAECEAIEKNMVRDMIARIASDNEKHGHVTTETLADAEKMISDMPFNATRGVDMLLKEIPKTLTPGTRMLRRRKPVETAIETQMKALELADLE